MSPTDFELLVRQALVATAERSDARDRIVAARGWAPDVESGAA